VHDARSQLDDLEAEINKEAPTSDKKDNTRKKRHN